MYQVVAVSKSPERRTVFGSFPVKLEAKEYATSFEGHIEVVNEKTGLLVGAALDGEWHEQTAPARREVL